MSTLTQAQLQAVIAAGGVVALGGRIYSVQADVPNDAAIAVLLAQQQASVLQSTPGELNALSGQGALAADFAKLHALAASAAEINALAGQGAAAADFADLHAFAAAFGSVAFDRATKIARVALGHADTAGGIFAWANPEAGSILITRVIVDVTTIATGACTLDIGTTAASAATLSDTLLDGIDVHSAIGQFDNLLAANAGTNGLTALKLAAGKWVTGSMASGAAAGLAGFAYVHYVNV